MIVFDFDGCLADTEQIIRRAYADAGVPDAGDDLMSRGQHRRIFGDKIYDAKDAAYLRRIAAEPVRLLPPWQVARRLRAEGRTVALLSGAPEGTVAILAQRLPVWPFRYARAGMGRTMKTEWLTKAGHGVYVDDQDYVIMPPGWRLVRYTGQSASILLEQIGGT